jgi:signal transduction histidine kinase
MKLKFFLFVFIYLLSLDLIGQVPFSIPTTKDSLESFILNRRSKGNTDMTYFLALKTLSKFSMYENRKATITYLNEALTIAESYRDTLELASINHLMGQTYRYWGYTYAAAEYFQQAFILNEKIGRKGVAGYDILSIGNVYFDLKKWQEADFYYRKAIHSFSEREENSGSATAMNNIALVFQEKANPDSALLYFNNALNFRRKQGDSILVAQSYWYLSTIYLDLKDIQKGLYYGNLSLSYFEQNKNHKYNDLYHLPLAIHYYLGRLYQASGKNDEAIHHWNSAIAIGKKNPNMSHYFIASYREIALYLVSKSKLAEAEAYLKNGLKYALDSRFQEETEKLYIQIADLYEKLGKYAESLQYLREYQLLIKNKTTGISNQMTSFHVLFETYEQQTALREKEVQLEKEILKQKQQIQLNSMYLSGLVISILGLFIALYLYRRIYYINKTLAHRNIAIQEKNSIIESNAQELQELHKTKDLLYSVIAHDLRAPFNTLTNFSKMMQGFIKNNQWQELKNSFLVLEESSQKAYWTFENLLGWIQGQTGKLEAKMKIVDIMPLMDEALGLSSSMLLLKNLRINKKIGARYLMADPYMLETVLRNLITNAIKFSPEGGLISISTFYENEKIKILICDEGIGMSEDEIKKLFNTESLKTSSHSISGLGMLICSQFIDSMQGTLSVLSKNDLGSKFEITLNAAETPTIEFGNAEILEKNNSEEAPILSNSSKMFLKQFYPELEKLTVYEASEIKEILKTIQKSSIIDADVEFWLSKVNKALYLSDANAFEKLRSEIS